MATSQVIADAVARALDTARIDQDAPTEPRDERCQFEPAALADVVKLCASGSGREAVTAALEDALQQSVADLNADRTLAATILRTRIAAATTSRPVRVENIQGDVGTGSGPTPDL